MRNLSFAAKMPSIVIVKPPAGEDRQDWPLLSGLRKALTVVTKALMGGFLGAWVLGISAMLATIFCYGIGVYLGLPLGLLLGLYFGVRLSTEDVLFTFGVSVASWIVLYRVVQVPTNSPPDVLFYQALPPVSGALVASVTLAAKGFIPIRWKQILGGFLSLAVAVWCIAIFLIRIYR